MKNRLSTIIGGGAAGLCAAILIGRAGKKVTLLEQNKQVGKKILISGNGKCNITNYYIGPERFHSSNPSFIATVLKEYGFKKVEKFLCSIGLELHEGKEGKMFPLSLHAASVVELLEYEAKRVGVEIICDCKVIKVIDTEKGFMLETSQGKKETATLLVTTGSLAAPQLGGNDSGYLFGTTLGHTLVPCHPALVQLCSKELWVRQCAGVKINGIATLYVNGEQITQRKGDLLFTNYGISGLAILDLSREVSARLTTSDHCELSLDLMPTLSKEKLNSLLLKKITPKSSKPTLLWLQGILHKKLAKTILIYTKCRSKTEGELNRKEINKLVHTIKNLKLSINDTKGLKYAEVIAGGINTQEIDPFTMCSKIIPNLYFAGEILDVDGDRGGFNFHFAWISAMRAAEAIIKL
ncbi:MAG: NAD(P)/FAD-dependent oxidoreductase [Sulfurovum sp.]|nr:NAD(P)/FAD-dependent oxidoreductase [Sulfurovum sp.]